MLNDYGNFDYPAADEETGTESRPTNVDCAALIAAALRAARQKLTDGESLAGCYYSLRAQGYVLRRQPMIELRLHVEPLDRSGLPRCDRLTILRGQLTIIRVRAEKGIPVSVESIARAESVARSLEAQELAE